MEAGIALSTFVFLVDVTLHTRDRSARSARANIGLTLNSFQMETCVAASTDGCLVGRACGANSPPSIRTGAHVGFAEISNFVETRITASAFVGQMLCAVRTIYLLSIFTRTIIITALVLDTRFEVLQIWHRPETCIAGFANDGLVFEASCAGWRLATRAAALVGGTFAVLQGLGWRTWRSPRALRC